MAKTNTTRSSSLKYRAFLDVLIKRELKGITESYNLTTKVISRIVSRLRHMPESTGDSLEVLNILHEVFDSYGYTGVEFEEYIDINADVINANPEELKKRLIVLNFQGLLDSVIFEHPSALYRNTKIDYHSIFAICRNLKLNDEEVSYDTVFSCIDYSHVKLEELKNAFPLSDARFRQYELKYKLDLARRKQENEMKMTLKEE